MCGIAGVRRLDGAPVQEQMLQQMVRTLEHRGPDGAGHWIDGATGFGHTRLAIIDLAGSAQPMASRNGDVHVCFNGEIFNYRELRRELGGAWRTDGDTEVLLTLFDRHGPEGVHQLRGQFAYAIADQRDGSLWLFRDRLGVLPLYYMRTGEAFLFASEAKALLAAMPTSPSVDEDSLGDYLARRAVPAPSTLFRGVKKLAPGSWLHLRADGTEEVQRWWRPEAQQEWTLSPQDAVSLVHDRLQTAVARALVADVPVGAYLSGGVDSSLIVAMTAQQRGARELHTFAAGFGDPRVDELHHARVVADHVGTQHHEVVLEPADFLADWDKLTWHRDAPLSEPADIAVHRLAQAAGQHVKVVLSGEGSDELFAGYPKHRWLRCAEQLGRLPHAARGPVSRAVDAALPPRFGRARVAVRALGERTAAQRDDAWFAPFTSAERRRLLGSRFEGPRDVHAGDPLRRVLAADLVAWLPDNLLERGDRMTMAASVELRPPFLDADLVEAALRLPPGVLLRGGTTKWVVKQVARNLLPAAIVDRPKAGFRVPLDAWFRTGLAAAAHERLLDPASFVAQVFDRTAVLDLLLEHTSGRRNHDIRLWTLLSLETWHETCVRRHAVSAQTSPRCLDSSADHSM